MIKGLIFDINGTLSEIWTNEEDDSVFRTVAAFLTYQGVLISPEKIKELYLDINKRQRTKSNEPFPEFDAVALFAEIIETHSSAYTQALPSAKRYLLPTLTAEVFRAASLHYLKLYDGVAKTLSALQEKYRLAAVSDGQKVWALPELNAVGLGNMFDPFIVSSDFGFRKPDQRLFQRALTKMHLSANEVVFIGNDLYHDIWGANQMGIKTVFFQSNQGNHDFTDAKPDYVIRRFDQLPKALHFLKKKTA